MTESGCQLTGLIINDSIKIYQYHYDYEPPNNSLVARQQILHHPEECTVYLISDSVDVHYSWRKESSCSYLPIPRFFLRKSYCQAFQISAQEQPKHAPYVSEPVLLKLMEALQKDAVRFYGRDIRLLAPPTDFRGYSRNRVDKNRIREYFQALLHRPLNMNIYFFRKYFRDEDKFNQLFPKDQQHNFGPLAKLLHLPPTEELCQAYEKNPLSLIFCLMLPELGIKDKGLIQKFFSLTAFCGKTLEEHYQKELFFDPLHTGPTEYLPDDESADYESLRFYCQWRRKHESEEALANLLLERQQGWCDWKYSAFKVFQKYFNHLPKDLKEDILRDGISAQIHDKLKLIRQQFQKADAPCGERELARQCKINDYNFRLIKSKASFQGLCHTYSLPWLSYKKLAGMTLYAIERNGRYLGVITVKGNISENVFINDCNCSILQAKCHTAYLAWVRHHNLERTATWPEDCVAALEQNFDIEPLDYDEFNNISLIEMLDMPERSASPGFFLQLYRKLAEASLLRPLAPDQSADEQEYLFKKFPYGQLIFQAAFAGNPEAQYVMSIFYRDNHCIAPDSLRAEIWYKRAIANGWLEIAPAQKDVRIDFYLHNNTE